MNYYDHTSDFSFEAEHDKILIYCFAYSLPVECYYGMVSELRKGHQIHLEPLNDTTALLFSYKPTVTPVVPDTIYLCMHVPINAQFDDIEIEL